MKKKTFSALMSLVLCLCMLVSMMVVPAAAAEIKDMDDGHWAKASAERWTKAGVMTLDANGNFNPEKEMTRAEFAVILCELMGYTEKADASTFVDLPADKATADAILKLKAAGVMNGVGENKVDPDGKLTREHVAVMVFRALKLTPAANTNMTFTDAADVSDWAKAEMATMASLKMIEGYEDNTLRPQDNISNAEMAALLDKMIADYVTENGATVDLSKDGTTNPNGVVIIKANNVKIANAAGSTAVVITEAAPKGATVTVTGPASDITVAAEGAKVTVAKDAKVDALTVEAPNASVTVNGAVGAVAVAKDAETAKVTVAKGATVDSVTVEAPKAAVEVSGTVTDVAVAAGADNTTVTAKSGAKVDNVTTSAEGVKVNGAKNAIQNVTANAGSADIKANGATVKNDGADNVKVDGKTVANGEEKKSTQTGSGTSSSSGGGGGGGGTTNPTTYTVTFNSQGGSAVAEINNVTSGSKITKPADPTRDGYTFGGWYKEAACTNAWDFDTDTVTAATTLYAKWTENPPAPTEYDITGTADPEGSGTVTFTVDGKTVTKAVQGAEVTIVAAPATGYEVGTMTVDGTAVTGNTFTMPAKNVTVTVTFTAEAKGPAIIAPTKADVILGNFNAALTGADKPYTTAAIGTPTFVAATATTPVTITVKPEVTGLKAHPTEGTEFIGAMVKPWVGIGVPAPSTYGEGVSVQYYTGWDTADLTNLGTASDKDNTQTEDGKTYDTFYWGVTDTTKKGYLVAVYSATDKTNVTVLYVLDFNNVTLATEPTKPAAPVFSTSLVQQCINLLAMCLWTKVPTSGIMERKRKE